ncbi:MAG: ketoisovalerate oxidoreductase [Clostridia bacterium]|nr:ketoisovalerate oxidoreductase [Clostridia bacterium]
MAFVQISDEPISSPKFKTADIAVAFSRRSIQRISKYCGPETLFIYEDDIEDAEGEFPSEYKKTMGIPAVKIAREKLHPKVFNVLMMGTIVGITNVVKVDQIKKEIENRLGYIFEKNPDLRTMNFEALEIGVELAANE